MKTCLEYVHTPVHVSVHISKAHWWVNGLFFYMYVILCVSSSLKLLFVAVFFKWQSALYTQEGLRGPLCHLAPINRVLSLIENSYSVWKWQIINLKRNQTIKIKCHQKSSVFGSQKNAEPSIPIWSLPTKNNQNLKKTLQGFALLLGKITH